jgi:hypothetical protein
MDKLNWMQTVEIVMPYSSRPIFGLEPRPFLPEGWEHLKKCYDTSGWYYTFEDDGSVRATDRDGIFRIWWPKPTLQDAVNLRGMGATFHFRSDGSVLAENYFGENYFWGKECTYHRAEIELEDEFTPYVDNDDRSSDSGRHTPCYCSDRFCRCY